IKNYILTLDIQKIVVDQERNYGFVMYIAACVYDWCYDLMSTTDKLQIVSGIEHKIVSGSNSYGVKMEIGFPPSKQNAIAGHGSEFQLLRDYLAFAIAIYDEYPGWWEYIGGRFYAEFVPVRNEYYKAGMYPQGVSLYVRVRYASDLYSAWLIKAATGSLPYDDPEGMKQVMRTVYAYELPNGNAFETGDNHTEDAVFQDYGRLALISSYLFDDPTIRAELEYHKKSYTSFSETLTMSATVAEYLICSNGVTTPRKRHTDMPLIQYNGGWLGQIIARNNWGDDQAAVLMKIGERTTANHDPSDAGQFQIWYKTMLAGDTGAYDTYGDTHFKKYHQATIAHNCLLIGGAGQKQPGETGNINTWKGDGYKMGTVNGYAWGYADEKETQPTYAYIAGNITPAYDSSSITEVTRRMLTVYDTKNANVPLFFFVFDNITTSSTSTKKTFLLHVPTEPTILGNTVTVTKAGARLTLQSVIGGDSITKVGGTNNNYNVNGTQINPTNNGNDGFWGRVEISPNTGSKT
ncbi:MAG: heparinase II/III family protein, partial [Clostridia bacterium]|nr:heparinase II/III family protein [Clostridia bacterium]